MTDELTYGIGPWAAWEDLESGYGILVGASVSAEEAQRIATEALTDFGFTEPEVSVSEALVARMPMSKRPWEVCLDPDHEGDTDCDRSGRDCRADVECWSVPLDAAEATDV